MADSEVELSLLLIELFRLMVSTRPIESFGSLHLDSLKLVPLETCFSMMNVKGEVLFLVDMMISKVATVKCGNKPSSLHACVI